jgi:hypothetical protein
MKTSFKLYKRIVTLLLVIALYTAFVSAQTKEFKVPESNKGVLVLKVNEADTVIIKEDSAYVLSKKALDMYEEFYTRLELCYNERDSDIMQIKMDLKEFQLTLNKLQELVDKGDSISIHVLAETEQKLGEVLTNLEKNITDLKSVQAAIDEASEELANIEKLIKKEKARRVWYKFGDMIMAGAAGLIVGALLF